MGTSSTLTLVHDHTGTVQSFISYCKSKAICYMSTDTTYMLQKTQLQQALAQLSSDKKLDR